MFGFLKKKVEDLQASASKFRDRETAEAIVAVMIGTAFADGDLEPEEQRKFAAALQVNPLLKQFDATAMMAKWNELKVQFEFDLETGRAASLKELEDVARQGASEEKRLLILRMGAAAAKADGEIEPAERAFLGTCAHVLGLTLDQVGL